MLTIVDCWKEQIQFGWQSTCHFVNGIEIFTIIPDIKDLEESLLFLCLLQMHRIHF